MNRPLLATLLLLSPLASAGSVSTAEQAQIQREQQKERETVQKKYGDKKPGQLSSSERLSLAKELEAADKKVLDQHGVSPKDWATASTRRGREERAEVEAAGKALAEKEEAQKKQAAGAKAGGAPGEVKVQRGFSNDKPAVLEDKNGGQPEIEIQRGPTKK